MKAITEKYDWPILDEMPEGWRIDKTVGSPVHDCVFITDGKSVRYFGNPRHRLNT